MAARDCSNTWEIHKIDENLNKQLIQDFRGERSGYLQVGEKRYFFPKKFEEHSSGYKNFKTRHDDTWVVSFPRSGTTWTQEMVWLICNDLDFDTAQKIPLTERFPFLEYHACVNDEVQSELLKETGNDLAKEQGIKENCQSAIDMLEKMSTPRFIKTHLPFSLLPNDLLECGAKIVYVARNPKDVTVSYYHFHRLLKTLDFTGDFPKFWDYFERNLVLWAPYWEHIAEGWNLRNHPSVKFLFYENLNKDITDGIKEVSAFLGKKLTDDQIAALSRHLDFKNFRNNMSVNMETLNGLGMMNDYSHRHIRKGNNGSWKEVSNKELDQRAEKWISDNLKKYNIKFPLTF